MNTKAASILTLAEKLTRIAGEKLVAAFQTHSNLADFKSDHSLVTVLDNEIEDFFIKEIHQVYPTHTIHGEETGDHPGSDEITWYLDPLDGTSNLSLNLSLFGTMIGIAASKQLIGATIYNPLSRLHFTANVKQQILTINNQRISPARQLPLSSITVICDAGKNHDGKIDLLNFLKRNESKFRSVRIPGSISSHVIPLSSDQPTVSLTFDAPTHDLLPVAACFQAAGYFNSNRQGNAWTISDQDLISFPLYVKDEIISILNDEEEHGFKN